MTFLKDNNVLKNLKNYLLTHPENEWLICKTNFRYEKYNFDLELFPYQYPKLIVQKGFAHNCSWGFIQQESTIFSKNLYYSVGGLKKIIKWLVIIIYGKTLLLKKNLFQQIFHGCSKKMGRSITK